MARPTGPESCPNKLPTMDRLCDIIGGTTRGAGAGILTARCEVGGAGGTAFTIRDGTATGAVVACGEVGGGGGEAFTSAGIFILRCGAVVLSLLMAADSLATADSLSSRSDTSNCGSGGLKNRNLNRSLLPFRRSGSEPLSVAVDASATAESLSNKSATSNCGFGDRRSDAAFGTCRHAAGGPYFS